MRAHRGLTLLEVVVALAVLSIGVVSLQRLIGQSVAGLADDARLTHAMLAARTLLAEAVLAPPEPSVTAGERAGLPFTREVRPTSHPALREIRIEVAAGTPAAVALVELVHVPAR